MSDHDTIAEADAEDITDASSCEAPDKYRSLKDAFGRFATGITIVGCQGPDGEPVAITVNSFASVSLEPPLVLWCLDKGASTFDAFMASASYAVSVLRSDQQDISDRYAGFARPDSQAPVLVTGQTGSPMLETCLAAMDCKIVQHHDAGDHVILVGQVLEFRSHPGAPLTYFASQYGAGPVA